MFMVETFRHGKRKRRFVGKNRRRVVTLRQPGVEVVTLREGNPPTQRKLDTGIGASLVQTATVILTV